MKLLHIENIELSVFIILITTTTLSFLFLVLPFDFVHAETDIDSDITENTTWVKDQGPYVIQNDVSVYQGATLTIEPGTIIKFNQARLSVWGNLIANGTSDQNIYFTSIANDAVGGDTNQDGTDTTPTSDDNGGLDFEQGTATSSLSHVSFQYAGTIGMNASSADFQDVDIKDTYAGIFLGDKTVLNAQRLSLSNITYDALSAGTGSTLNLSSSTISNVGGNALSITNVRSNVTIIDSAINNASTTAIDIHGAIVLEGTGSNSNAQNLSAGFLTISNSLIQNNTAGILVRAPETMQISSSSIAHNTNYGIQNNTQFSVDATNNWWGDPSGPFNALLNATGTANSVSQNVNFIPWITQDPNQPKQPVCCSSIAFIPGIEASRLYVPAIIGESRIWEPSFTTNAKNLFLDSNGSSIRKDIYTRDIVGSGVGYDVYQNYIDHLNSLVANSTINSWISLPYDWRYGIDTITTKPIALSNGQSYSMIDYIENLAKSSKTGKVTIIAHSYGGLVGKALTNALVAKGEGNLVDKIILVASPQIGTPETISAMLHGDDQQILNQLILRTDSARTLGKNMPSSYELLPDQAYIATTSQPLITFDPSVDLLTNFRKVYGSAITTASKLSDFLTGKDGRSQPLASDVADIAVLNKNLLSQSTTIHSGIDSWVAPTGVSVYQISAWDLPTVSGLNYYAKRNCLLSNFLCTSYYLDHQPIITTNGDKIVMQPSATYLSNTPTYYFDVGKYNKDKGKNYNHAVLMEVPELDSLIDSLETNSQNYSNSYISRNQPTPNQILTLSVHSPVSLDVYDSKGNHTGLSAIQATSSDFESIDENIPNSSYMEFGEGKYITLDSTDSYKIQMQGLDDGSFTLDLSQSIDGQEIASTSYSNIPVSSTTQATLLLSQGSSTTPLSLDNNNDGVIDATITPDTASSTQGFWKYLRQMAFAIHCTKIEEKLILSLIDIEEKRLLLPKDKNKLFSILSLIDAKYNNSKFTKDVGLQYIKEIITRFEQ